jgi:putative FmdB family regulatory protein
LIHRFALDESFRTKRRARNDESTQDYCAMPTYEYVCDACEHEFDELQGYNDPVLTKCPNCGKKKLRRLFGTGAAVLFKGSGFYETDYRSDSYKAGAKKEQEATTPKTDKGDSSSSTASTDTSGTTGKVDAKPTETKTKTASKKAKSKD